MEVDLEEVVAWEVVDLEEDLVEVVDLEERSVKLKHSFLEAVDLEVVVGSEVVADLKVVAEDLAAEAHPADGKY